MPSRHRRQPVKRDIEARAERLATANSAGLMRYFLRRVPNREDAADLFAETLLVMWKRIRDMPSDDGEARPWLFGVARRVLSHHHRAGLRRQGLADALRAQVAATGEVFGSSPEALTELKALMAALDELDREIILLHAWEGFSHEEIAVIMEMKAPTVRSRYARARAQLRRSYDESRERA